MPKKIEVREGDTLTIKARVVRVSDDGSQVTIEVWGQRITQPIEYFPVEKHEKGNGWPG